MPLERPVVMVVRSDASISVGDAWCAAWVLQPDDPGQRSGTVVVMAHGFSLTRHDGLLPYAEAFAAAGCVVVVFDHRFLGDSGGEPRQRLRVREQRADWRALVSYARSLPGVDPGRLVLWGFSFSGGHVVALAPELTPAAVLALCPFIDGFARVRATPAHDAVRVLSAGVRAALGSTKTVPVTASPGQLGALTFAGEADGFARIIGPDSPWHNEISPAVLLGIAALRPVTKAAKITAPVWVGRAERDITVHAPALARLAERAPGGELHDYPYDHFDAFAGQAPATVAADQLAFLRRHGLVS
jgi:pimeloyl-ACP methyl ester carboxylesterase